MANLGKNISTNADGTKTGIHKDDPTADVHVGAESEFDEVATFDKGVVVGDGFSGIPNPGQLYRNPTTGNLEYWNPITSSWSVVSAPLYIGQSSTTVPPAATATSSIVDYSTFATPFTSAPTALQEIAKETYP